MKLKLIAVFVIGVILLIGCTDKNLAQDIITKQEQLVNILEQLEQDNLTDKVREDLLNQSKSLKDEIYELKERYN